jgi:ribulose-phosphate 3-epimerase
LKHLLAPSILSADFANLGRDVEMINRSHADWFHVDIMDGVFVPNISFGFPVVKAIKNLAKKPLDVHLMIVQPERYVKDFKQAGADILTVQYEACTHLHRIIFQIKEDGMKAGVAINPHIPVSFLREVIQYLDLVLVMSVNPGFGGQKFITHSLAKLRELRKLISESGSSALIEIDGGVSLDNAKEIISAGADVLVAGNAVFGAEDPEETIRKFKKIEKTA